MTIQTLPSRSRWLPCLGLLWLLTGLAAQARITLMPARQLVVSEQAFTVVRIADKQC